MTDDERKVQAGCDHLARHDITMAGLIATYDPPTFAATTQYYQTLVTSIISQQLSVKAAATIQQRFVALFGDFPVAGDVLQRDSDELRSVGLSGQKVVYIRDLSERVVNGSLDFTGFADATNETIITELTRVKGVGVWTAHMFLMFCLGRLDVLADGDLGIKNALARLYGMDATCTSADVQAIADRHHWQPYASIACWYAWQSLDNKPIV